MAFSIRKGDQVVVLSGKDKGSTGKVIEMIPEKGAVIVDNVNMVTRHQRPRQTSRPGVAAQTGRIQKPAPLPVGKVQLICPQCDVKTRVGHGVTSEGRRVRLCKKCGKDVDIQ